MDTLHVMWDPVYSIIAVSDASSQILEVNADTLTMIPTTVLILMFGGKKALEQALSDIMSLSIGKAMLSIKHSKT
eukprot:8715211-Ditylum_brightwellii.AAC.1